MDSFIYFGCNFGLYSLLERLYRTRFGLPKDKMLPAVSALLVGMLADAITLIVDTPIETVCMRLTAGQGKEGVMDIIRSIHKTSGFWSYWNGIETTLSYSPLRQAIIFFVYERLKSWSLAVGSTISSIQAFTFGAAGEAIATCIIYPLFYIRIKQATDPGDGNDKKKDRNGNDSLASLLYREVKQHGIVRLYSGLTEEVISSAGKGALRFVIKEWLQKFWLGILTALFR